MYFSDSISAVIETLLQQNTSLKAGQVIRLIGVRHQLKPKKSMKAEQAGAFFSSESGEKKRTGRVGLSVTSCSRNANP
jgi:hypothetical protein